MPDTQPEIDTLNTFGVGVVGSDVAILMWQRRISRVDALLLAAWLVALAEDNDGEFARVLQAVRST